MIRLNKIRKAYKLGESEFVALKNISLNINKDEFVSIIGKSGSGKSTLIKIIGLIDSDYSGELFIDGQSMINMNDNEISKKRQHIGFVFQDFQLLERYNVYKNVEIPYIIKYKRTNRALIESVLMSLDLLDKQDNLPNELSGGQKQRVAIARALVTSPSIIIADEPTGALDNTNSQEVMKILKQVNIKGITVLVVTHDIDIAKQCDRIIEISDGVTYD